jgi:hypothetical protein
VQTPADIRSHIAELSEQRAVLWKELAVSHDSVKAEECRRLSETIEELWLELRTSRLELRFGPREKLIARARATARLEDELNRRLKGRSRGPARRIPAKA